MAPPASARFSVFFWPRQLSRNYNYGRGVTYLILSRAGGRTAAAHFGWEKTEGRISTSRPLPPTLSVVGSLLLGLFVIVFCRLVVVGNVGPSPTFEKKESSKFSVVRPPARRLHYFRSLTLDHVFFHVCCLLPPGKQRPGPRRPPPYPSLGEPQPPRLCSVSVYQSVACWPYNFRA